MKPIRWFEEEVSTGAGGHLAEDAGCVGLDGYDSDDDETLRASSEERLPPWLADVRAELVCQCLQAHLRWTVNEAGDSGRVLGGDADLDDDEDDCARDSSCTGPMTH